MFFFIAGIQPKTINLDEQLRMCPSCGLYQARMKRVDHYLSVFFLPIVRVKKGPPFLLCQSCGAISQDSGETWAHYSERGSNLVCPYCSRELDAQFRFCPFCGRPVT
ncbi:MAG: zinc ribbon domain-containing protein [Pseudomonadota bacterium]